MIKKGIYSLFIKYKTHMKLCHLWVTVHKRKHYYDTQRETPKRLNNLMPRKKSWREQADLLLDANLVRVLSSFSK